MKKMMFVFLFIAVLSSMAGANPVLIPEPIAQSDAASIYFYPEEVNVRPSSYYELGLRIESVTNQITSFEIQIKYDPSMMTAWGPKDEIIVLYTSYPHFSFIAKENEPGVIDIKGFDEKNAFYTTTFDFMLKMNFLMKNIEGSTEVNVEIKNLNDRNNKPILYNDINPAFINISEPYCEYMIGDANRDQVVDVVDALRVAYYYICLCADVEDLISQCAADVNLDNKVDIVDALVICQYYVGIIKELPMQ